MLIQTKRLKIFPLTKAELGEYRHLMTPVESLYVEHVMDGTPFNTVWVAMDGLEFVGELNFHGLPENDEVEIGAQARVHGKGYMTEAVNGMVDMCRELGLKAVTAKIDSENKASERVAEKCGFSKENEIWKLKL